MIGLVAGPEIGIGAEATALLDLMGAELFLLALGGAQIILFWGRIKDFCEHIDPYFFIPTRRQIAQVPGIVAHAIPGLMSIYICGLLTTIADAFES